jgi:hypothetical protein
MVTLAEISRRAEPRGCPFCLTHNLHTLASFDDTLAAYRCHVCAGVFYTIDLRIAARASRVTDLLQRPPRRDQRGRPLRARRPALAYRSLARWLPAATSPQPRHHLTLPLPGQPLNRWVAQR